MSVIVSMHNYVILRTQNSIPVIPVKSNERSGESAVQNRKLCSDDKPGGYLKEHLQ